MQCKELCRGNLLDLIKLLGDKIGEISMHYFQAGMKFEWKAQ